MSSGTAMLENALVPCLPKPNQDGNIRRNETTRAQRCTFVAFPRPQPRWQQIRAGAPSADLCLGWSSGPTKCSFPEKGEFSWYLAEI